MLEENGYEDDTIKEIKIATIHSFQGQERRLIILDFTDNNIMPSRLTAKKELINVAISRAKEQLCIIGNQDYLLNKTHFKKSEVKLFETICNTALLCPLALSD